MVTNVIVNRQNVNENEKVGTSSYIKNAFSTGYIVLKAESDEE